MGPNSLLSTEGRQNVSPVPWMSCAAHQWGVGVILSWVANTQEARDQNHSERGQTIPWTRVGNEQANDGFEASYQKRTWRLLLSCRAQWRWALQGRATPVSWAHVILVHSQRAPAVFVLSDLQLSTLLRRFTSEKVSCYLGCFNKGPSISMRKIQKATNV